MQELATNLALISILGLITGYLISFVVHFKGEINKDRFIGKKKTYTYSDR